MQEKCGTFNALKSGSTIFPPIIYRMLRKKDVSLRIVTCFLGQKYDKYTMIKLLISESDCKYFFLS